MSAEVCGVTLCHSSSDAESKTLQRVKGQQRRSQPPGHFHLLVLLQSQEHGGGGVESSWSPPVHTAAVWEMTQEDKGQKSDFVSSTEQEEQFSVIKTTHDFKRTILLNALSRALDHGGELKHCFLLKQLYGLYLTRLCTQQIIDLTCKYACRDAVLMWSLMFTGQSRKKLVSNSFLEADFVSCFFLLVWFFYCCTHVFYFEWRQNQSNKSVGSPNEIQTGAGRRSLPQITAIP